MTYKLYQRYGVKYVRVLLDRDLKLGEQKPNVEVGEDEDAGKDGRRPLAFHSGPAELRTWHAVS
jgi:hypothetical protein